MLIKIGARANSRALAGGLLLGAAVGFVLGGAYLAGDLERAAVAHDRVLRLSDAAAHGFAEDALRAETAQMTPGALAVARRHDPFTSAVFAAPGDHQAAVFAGLYATPVSSAPVQNKPLLLRTGFAAPAQPIRPFRFASGDAMDSARDLDCLAEAVYYEARGETAAGQAAVAQVVLNRVRHPAFPKSVCGVVFQGAHTGDTCQFSFACDGSMRRPREADAWRRAEKVAARALEGFVMPSVGNATHFHVAGLEPGWGPRLLRVAQIGLHVFYRFGGYAGAPSRFNGVPQHSVEVAALTPVDSVSADGRPMGQYILASATVTQQTPPAQVEAPKAPAREPAPTIVETAPKTEASPKAKTEPTAKPETSAQSAKPAPTVAVS